MMSDGITTPAIHGSKYTSISCKPKKYQGAFDGFIVRVGLDGSSSGAFNVIDQIMRIKVTMMAARNSMRSRNGQTCTSLAQPGFQGCVLRWCVLASAGLASSSPISRSLANACRSAYHV